MPHPRRSSVAESVITHTAPVQRGDRLEWSGRLASDTDLDVDISFTWLGGRYRPTARPWLLAFLTAAMRSGRDRLVVDGPVDQGTIDGLMEYQELHHRWWPQVTRIVEIRADVQPAARVPRRAGAVSAFSGGVDSAFSLLRHSPSAEPGPYRQTRLTAALMVHGFDISHTSDDISHTSDDHFPQAWERSRRMLEAHGVTPLVMRTNLREVSWKVGNSDWGSVAHGPALASALACVEQVHHVVVIPSSYPYDHPIAWGSTPLADPLLGSGSRPIWHDGAAYDKLDKVLTIAHDPAVAANLRVCWVGKQQDRNCGRCFKCLMTQACFWLAGEPRPGAFDTPGTPTEIAALDLAKDGYKLMLAKHMRTEATTRGHDAVATALDTAIRAVGKDGR